MSLVSGTLRGGTQSPAFRGPYSHKEGETSLYMFTQKCRKVWCINHIVTATEGHSQGGFPEVRVQGGPELYLQNLGGRRSQPTPPQGHTDSSLEADSVSPQDGPRTHGRDPRFRPPEIPHIYHTTTAGQTAEDPQHGDPLQAFPDRSLASI